MTTTQPFNFLIIDKIKYCCNNVAIRENIKLNAGKGWPNIPALGSIYDKQL